MIEGRYFAPMRSASQPARLWRAGGELLLHVEGEVEPRRPKLLSLSESLGNVPRKFMFEDGSAFEAAGGADVDGMMGTRGSFFSVLSRVEANWKLAVIAVLVTIPLLFGIHRYGLPLAASFAAHATPASLMELMDTGVLKTVDTTLLGPSQTTESRKTEIGKLFTELAAASGHGLPDLQLVFRDGIRTGPNAFALPGGTLILTDQLIAKAKSDDEIAGVIAHEIAHVEHRHGLQQIYRVLGIAFMIGLVAGDTGQIVNEVVSQAAALQTLAYSRAFESEADARSIELMLAVDRNPLAFINLLERISGQSETNYLSSHPGTDERRKSAEDKLRSMGR
jgi:Zn-dependent protease with chaperone function